MYAIPVENAADLSSLESEFTSSCKGLLARLGSCETPPLDEFLVPESATPRRLTERQQNILTNVMSSSDQEKDVIIDLAKSASRETSCSGCVPCIVTNSQPWRVRDSRYGDF